MTRYFPELVSGFRRELPPRCVLDGEIVVVRGTGLDFEALQQRIHPAKSRVDLLAEQTPASFVAFDVLALDDEDLCDKPFRQRRAALEATLAGAGPPVFITPATDDEAVARIWFEQFEGAGLDGVVAKPPDLRYRPDQRVMFKIKHARTADCVVAGFRWHKSGPVVGSLLLGLYTEEGDLNHVGVAASFPMARRRALLDELAPFRMESFDGHPWATWAGSIVGNPDAMGPPGAGTRAPAAGVAPAADTAPAAGVAPAADRGTAVAGPDAAARLPGGLSRWNRDKDPSWEPLRPELVCEVAYDHMEGNRFRHTAQFRRWRPDREPRSCAYAQLERPVSFDLAQVLTAR
ncbi:MAG: ATP-dependent DNA ligase [Frankiaceae bacterium]